MILHGKVDYIYELRKDLFIEFGKEASRDFYINLARLIISTNTRDAKDKLKKEYETVLEAYNNMGDKTEYIFKVSDDKKNLSVLTAATTFEGFRKGCKIFRVHDVAENLAVLNLAKQIL